MAFVSDPLIDKFYKNLSIKGSEAQKQRPYELLWMLWFDRKSISNVLVAIQRQFAENEFFRPCATVKSLSTATA